jgi:PAS domain S-box-containing protein
VSSRTVPSGVHVSDPQPGRGRPGERGSPVRILVAEPPPGRGGGLGTVEALRRLGRGVRIEVAHDAAAGFELARTGSLDLVVVDGALGAEGRRLLAALRGDGPPALVVARDADPGAALDGFCEGAADCIVAGPDFDEVLPAAALEQIRAWRAAREHERLARDVEALRLTLGNVVDNMGSGLLALDPDGRVLAANPAAGQILAEAPGTLVGREVGAWLLPAANEGAGLSRALREGACVRGAEAVLRRRDGRFVPVGLSCAPLAGAEGERPGAILIFQDLSELKQLQRQVLQTEKMASIGQLAAGVAHEINNPMGFIHANLSQMQEYLADLGRVVAEARALAGRIEGEGAPDAAARFRALEGEVDVDYLLEDFAKAIRESQEGAERIRHIVADLRAFSHRDDGEWVQADLNRCLDSTAHIVWTMMKHSVVLRKEYAQLPPVRCRPLQVEQVFMNLLVNAYQAIEQRMRERGGSGEIVLSTALAEGAVVVSVGDDGIGIAPEDADRVFDPFFTTKEVGVGTGLGLSTSFDIVRRHGGTLRALDRPGGGTIFEVVLPIDGPPASGTP